MRQLRPRRMTAAVLAVVIGATAVAAQQGSTRHADRGNPNEQQILKAKPVAKPMRLATQMEDDPKVTYLKQRLIMLEARLAEERLRGKHPDSPSVRRMVDEREQLQLLQELARAQHELRGEGKKRPAYSLGFEDVQALNDEQLRRLIEGLCWQVTQLESRVQELEEASKTRIIPCK